MKINKNYKKSDNENLFLRLKKDLLKTKKNIGFGFINLFRNKKIDSTLFEELEERLLISDVGIDTTRKIITNISELAKQKQYKDSESLYELVKSHMGDILKKVEKPLLIEDKKPFVILMVGTNGSGKTVTVGKLAYRFKELGKSVMLAAGDTFRAAAIDQLLVFSQNYNIPIIAKHVGVDSASVIFNAMKAAKSRSIDILIIDTAGRLQNKMHLMSELKKIVRIIKKIDENAPHEVMLIIDANIGQNAIIQAKSFHEAIELTGITLTKLDGTAKGGMIFAVADRFGIPIRYMGVGERIEDLNQFSTKDFIKALFSK